MRAVGWEEEASERIPPHDEQAEAALCGAALLGRVSALDPSLLFVERYRRILGAAQCVELPSVITVAAHLRDTGALAAVGGVGVLIEALNAVPALSARDLASYEEIITGCARRRQTREVAARLVAQLDAGALDVDALTSEAWAALSSSSPKTGLRFLGPEAIWRPLESPNYLVEGLLVRGSLVLLAA